MSTYKIVDTNIKPEEHKIFFDEKYGHIIRIDQVTHNEAKYLKEMSEGNTWFSREINMKEDKTKFDRLPEDAKRAFKLNIIYQTLMDSGVTEGITDCIVKCVSTPIWEILYRRIAMEETIHSESYSYCLNEVFGSETSAIIDLVYTDEMVKKRMNDEAEMFGNLHELLERPHTTPEELEEKKIALLKVFSALYCLEGIKFPFSFLVTFTINDSYDNAIPGFTNNIRLIAHDELNTHVPTSLHLFHILKNEPHQGFSKYFNEKIENSEYSFFEKTLIDNINKVVEQEIEWAKYLLENKSVKGLNVNIAEYFIKWRARTLIHNLNINYTKYDSYVDNAITSFFDNYRDINKHNTALQEVSNTAYQKGTVKNDL